jgi:hypothetical protein
MRFGSRVNSRVPVWVLAMVTAVGLVGSTALGMGAFASVQGQSQVALQQSVDTVQARILAVQPQRDALALAISNGKQLLADSNGKTLDDVARAALNSALVDAASFLAQVDAQITQAQSELTQLSSLPESAFQLPWDNAATAERLASLPTPSFENLAQVVSTVGAQIKAVQAAQGAWQAEQDRIAAAAAEAAAAAARAAARAAAARAAAAAQSLAETGGSTTSTTPSAPTSVEASAPVVAGFSAENYIAAIAPNAYVVWVANMCAQQYPGQNVYLCGFATMNLNGRNTDRVPITLDSTLADRYANSVGVSVLVHEAAHARQWFKYGGTIESAWTTSTGLSGRSAVEYMADCATIVKLGYGTGTYIPRGQSCSARDQAEAATYWR